MLTFELFFLVGSKEDSVDLEKLVLEKHNWFKQYDVTLPGSALKKPGEEMATATPVCVYSQQKSMWLLGYISMGRGIFKYDERL